MEKEYMPIAELAKELNLDRSNVKDYVVKQGFEFVKIRTLESKGQLTYTLSIDDAKAIIEMRKDQGFLTEKPVNNGPGFFYVVQLIPELMANRIKLGFAGNVESRLKDHRTAAPTAILIKYWPCNKGWERTAMASITRIECECIGVEVFECEDLDNLIERADTFFSIMP